MKKEHFLSIAASLLLLLSAPTSTFGKSRLDNLKDLIEILGKIDGERAKNVKSGYFKNHTLFGSWTETTSTIYNGHSATFKRKEFDIFWLPLYSFDMEVSYMYLDNSTIPSLTSLPFGNLKFNTIDVKNEFSDLGSKIELDFFTRWGGKILLSIIGFFAFLYVKNE